MSLQFRDRVLVSGLLEAIRREAVDDLRLVEVCGTHTAAFSRSGLRRLLPQGIRVVPGPGCPVCITPIGLIDRACQLSGHSGVTVLAFGDMAAVPGSRGSLLEARAAGGRVRVVASPRAALQQAAAQPGQCFVFFACGFETTAAPVAAMLLEAKQEGIKNILVLSALRRIAPAIRAILGRSRIDGLICPGHVAAIIGAKAFDFIPRKFAVPAVVAGFEPVDLLLAVWYLLRSCRDNKKKLVNAYSRAVSAAGNHQAQALLSRVFSTVPANWRGLGSMAASGFTLQPEFEEYDALARFGPVDESGIKDDAGCRCGQVLRGEILPPGCEHFASVCTPGMPLGPCMVSSEGSCAVYYRYERVAF